MRDSLLRGGDPDTIDPDPSTGAAATAAVLLRLLLLLIDPLLLLLVVVVCYGSGSIDRQSYDLEQTIC